MARADEKRVGLERPVPDEAPLDDEEPTPQPERHEEKLRNPRLRDFSFSDYKAILVRAGKESLDDNVPMLASALAYSTFLAIPSALLVLVGLFTLVAGPGTITTVMDHFSKVMPAQATDLLGGSLKRLDQHPASSVIMTVVGFVIALWSATGAMTSFMTAVNLAYDRKDRRNFVRKRVVAVEMVAVMVLAFALVAVLLILGPAISHWVGSAIDQPTLVSWLWWVGQWPVLLVGLLGAFAVLLYLSPDVDLPRWQFLTPGAVLAAFMWLAVSGLFAVYTSMFSSYNKTWGSLAAVIVMLTWLWLTGLALLFGAEVNAEVERSRKLRAQ
jgi:membrane protein